jgi:hypothetical protein
MASSERRQHPVLLERKDGTLVAWYRSLYAPRTGGAYDSHHWTAGIAGRTRRRSGRVAARGAGAAAAVRRTALAREGQLREIRFERRIIGRGWPAFGQIGSDELVCRSIKTTCQAKSLIEYSDGQ